LRRLGCCLLGQLFQLGIRTEQTLSGDAKAHILESFTGLLPEVEYTDGKTLQVAAIEAVDEDAFLMGDPVLGVRQGRFDCAQPAKPQSGGTGKVES
jgi:hypothetical protein